MKVALFAIASILAALPLGADLAGYDGKVDLRVEGATIVAEHHHDWSKRKAFVRIVDRTSGRELLRRESPALTTLWLSPDERYLVGLSQIKVGNRSQVLILSRDGGFVHEEAVRCSDPRLADIPCLESVTNFVHWYHKQDPGIGLTEAQGRPSALSVRAPFHVSCRVPEMLEGQEALKARCARQGTVVSFPLARR